MYRCLLLRSREGKWGAAQLLSAQHNRPLLGPTQHERGQRGRPGSIAAPSHLTSNQSISPDKRDGVNSQDTGGFDATRVHHGSFDAFKLLVITFNLFSRSLRKTKTFWVCTGPAASEDAQSSTCLVAQQEHTGAG